MLKNDAVFLFFPPSCHMMWAKSKIITGQLWPVFSALGMHVVINYRQLKSGPTFHPPLIQCSVTLRNASYYGSFAV